MMDMVVTQRVNAGMEEAFEALARRSTRPANERTDGTRGVTLRRY